MLNAPLPCRPGRGLLLGTPDHGAFLGPLRRRRLCAGLGLAAVLAAGGAAAQDEESLADKLLKALGLTADPGAMRGGELDFSGELWWVPAQGGVPAPLTPGDGFRSPMFRPDGPLLALKDGQVVEVGAAPPRPLAPAPGVVRLLALNPEHPGELVVLRDQEPLLARLELSPTGPQMPLVIAAEAKRDELLGWAQGDMRRVGKLQVTSLVQPAAGPVKFTSSILLTDGDGGVRTVASCDDIRCGQPALSPDGQRIVFVHSEL